MKTTNSTQKGFTLLELLTVMAIMAILSTVAVTGYFAAIRGIAMSRAVSGLEKTLFLARQLACTEGTKTSVICYNAWSGEKDARKAAMPSYVICKTLGQFTYISGNELYDEFTPLDRMFTKTTQNNDSKVYPIRLYNLTRGGWADVQETVQRSAYYGGGTFTSPEGDLPNNLTIALKLKARSVPGDWREGDAYGVAVSPVARLPKNVFFGNSSRDSLLPSSSKDSTAFMDFKFRSNGRGGDSDTDSTRFVDIVMAKTSNGPLAETRTVQVLSDGKIPPPK